MPDERVAALLPVVAAWVARLGGPRVDVAEATSDVVLTLLLGKGPTAGASYEAWAFGVTRGVVANHRRRAWVRRWIPGAFAEGVSARAPLADLERLRTARSVEALLEQLPAAQREVLVLCDVEERSSVEVAALLGIPDGTVRSRLRLARTRFRALAPDFHLYPGGDE